MENLLVKLINSVFLIFLHFILSGMVWFYIIQNQNMKTNPINEIKRQILSILLLIIFTIIIITILATYWLEIETIFFDKDNGIYDISNWITLIVEIGIGFSIALIILIYSRFKGKEDSKEIVEKTVKETLKEALVVGTSPTIPSPSEFITTSENDDSSILAHQIFENLDETIFEEPQTDEN